MAKRRDLDAAAADCSITEGQQLRAACAVALKFLADIRKGIAFSSAEWTRIENLLEAVQRPGDIRAWLKGELEKLS